MGKTPTVKLYEAIKKGNENEVIKCLEEGIDINYQKRGRITPLGEAVKRNKPKVVQLLIDKGADVNAKNKFSESLTAISFVKSLNICKLLIENGAEVNIKSPDGLTPLEIISIKKIKKELIQYLLDNGAEINHKVLTNAISSEAFDIDTIQVLLSQQHIDINQIIPPRFVNYSKGTILGHTIIEYYFAKDKQEYLKFISHIISMGADVNKKDVNGKSPLMDAFRRADAEDVEALLLKNGADKNDISQAHLIDSESYSMSSANNSDKCWIHIVYPKFKLRIVRNQEEIFNKDFANIDDFEKACKQEFKRLIEEGIWWEIDREIKKPSLIRKMIEKNIESLNDLFSHQPKKDAKPFKIKKAYEVIKKHSLKDSEVSKFNDTFDIMLDNDVLANAFTYIIQILSSGKQVNMGCSKVGGDPHLPKNLKWPSKDYQFFAQLNISDFKEFDFADKFPDSGIIYHFINDDDDNDDKIMFSDSDSIEELEICKNPHQTELIPEQILEFQPNFYFDFTDYRYIDERDEVWKNLPSNMINKISQSLGIKKLNKISTIDINRIFGKPTDFQMAGILPDNHTLIFQYEFAEGNIYIGVPYDDLKKGDFEDAYGTYQGT